MENNELQRDMQTKKGIRIHLDIQDFLKYGPEARTVKARQLTNQLQKEMHKFLDKAKDLFITAEQVEMYEDFCLSALASADAEISYEEHTLKVFDEIYSDVRA